ncbi:MAG: hypothetical protein EOP04_11855 [Proteobacteria bacterium]|nr:MAG: hypothetical protein EOP04_11855 [Pseudomonadota bacterium]
MNQFLPFKPIISTIDKRLNGFILLSLSGFRQALLQYINKNDDAGILGYCNELTLTSLFTAGLFRVDPGITAIQEYSVSDEKGRYGRPDIFVNYQNHAIWIESKFGRASIINHENHWDIEQWLEWDHAIALQQAEDYYLMEQKHVNQTYENGHFVMTLIFKEIHEVALDHIQHAESMLRTSTGISAIRSWYYDVLLLGEVDQFGKSRGLEVYGTYKGVGPSANLSTTNSIKTSSSASY